MKYPAEIIPSLRERWAEVGTLTQSARPLPRDDVLRRLLDVAYQSSFQVDEQRNTSVTIIFGDRTEFRTCAAFDTVLFPESRAFTAGEVSRLAPATDARQTMLCVGEAGDECEDDAALRIWGLLDVGTTWIEFAIGERSDTVAPPDLLTVTVHQPGAFTLSRSGTILLRFRDGKETVPTGSALEVGPIARRFESAAGFASGRLVAALAAQGVHARPEEFPPSVYTRFIRRVLFRIRSKRHGGTVIVVPESTKTDASHLTERLKIKYPLLHAGAWDDILRFVTSARLYSESRARDSDASRISAERKLAEHAAFIAGLAGVDGAVVLTDRYRILGFGAEVIVSSPELRGIQIARDPEGRTMSPVSIETYGTRHRSAIRFCHSFEPAVAFVVSQDGEVRAIARVGDDVLMWPEINAGGMGL